MDLKNVIHDLEEKAEDILEEVKDKVDVEELKEKAEDFIEHIIHKDKKDDAE